MEDPYSDLSAQMLFIAILPIFGLMRKDQFFLFI